MKLSKRVLSVLMALLMVFTVFQMSISAIDIAAGDNDENTKVMVDNGEGRYVLPTATLTATPVIRTAGKADGYGDYIVGNTIVQATPSGVPYTSGNYANEAYSGESPEWPTVTFECDLSLAQTSGSVNLETNISGAQIETSNPTNSKWVWTIKGGTISPGTFADFTVSYSYKYTDSLTGEVVTKAYKVYASSYVENVLQPGGMYLKSDRNWSFHSNNKCEAVVRILGHNTKGSYYPTGGDSGSSEWAHGVYDFQTRSAIGWGNTAAAYPNGGTVLYQSEKKKDGNITTNTSLDRNRPVSSTYIDTSKSTALNSADINLRYSVYFFGEHSEEYNGYLTGIALFNGEKSGYSTSNSSDVAAAQELNFALASGDSSYAYTCSGKGDPVVYNTSNPYAIFNSANSGKVLALNVPFRGTAYANSSNLETQADGNKLIKYTFVSAPAQRYYATDSGQVLAIHNAINMNLYLYSKAGLRGAIEDAIDNASQVPVSPTGSEIGVMPQAWYYTSEDDYNAYVEALRNAQHINAKYDTNQNAINAAANALNDAVAELEVASADYTAANALLNRYNNLKEENYTSESWAILKAAKNAVFPTDENEEVVSYTVFYQPLVNDLTAKFEAAFDKLVEALADTTRANEAAAVAQEYLDDPDSPYTEESLANLQELVDLVNSDEFQTKPYSEQEYVDGIADQIYDMISKPGQPGGLQYATADYSKVDALIAEFAARTDEDMYTEESWASYEYSTLDSTSDGPIIRNLPKTQQWLVDEMEADIIAAKAALELKPADYTDVNAAKAEANALEKNLYTADSWANLQAAIKAVKTGKKINEQSVVDGYAAAIRAAINALVIAGGDYTDVDAAIEEYNGLNKNWYKADGITAVEAAISAVNRGLDKTHQSEIDAMADAINAAIDALELKPADYTQANAQIARYNALDGNLYTSSSYKAAGVAKTALEGKFNLTIDKQSTVDQYTTALKNAIDNLQYKPGNYAAVNAAISNANELLAEAEDYAEAYNGNPYYTEDSVAALNAAIEAVVTGLTIDKQTQIDGYAQAINNAIAALECNVADYTAVDAAVASIPDDIDSGRYDDAKVAAVKNAQNAIEEGLLTDEQDTVDGYAAALDAAVKALTVKGADYSAVTAAIASKPADLTPYTFESVENLNSVINAVDYTLSIDEQATVDGYAAAILKAIDELELAAANYAKVEEAKAAANDALNGADKDNYTDASKQAVTDAVDAVVYNLPAAQQATVDGYADAINAAIDALELKPADYTAVDAAKAAAEAKAAEKDLYKSFDAVDAAVAAVVEGKNIKEQAEVDAMADAINAAIDALEYKDIDRTAYDAKVAEFNGLEKAIYTDDSVAAVEAAITAGDNFLAQDGLTIKDQADLDALTADLAEAIDALELKKADYTALEAKIAEFNECEEALYTNYFDQWMIVAEVEDWLANNGDLILADQGLVDEQTAIVAKAIEDLELALADYTELNAKIAEFYTYNEDDYTNYFDEWMIVSDVESWLADNGDLLLADQGLVDEQTAIVAKAIEDLKLVLADYTALEAKIAEFYTYPEDEYTNYFDQWMIVAEVESWLEENGALPKKDQGLVDEQTAIVAQAIEDLEPIAVEPTAYFKAREGSTTIINETAKTITGLKTQLGNKDMIETFLDYDGVTVTYKKASITAKYLGTGATVTVKWADGTVDVYTIIIYGDLDGSGTVTSSDAAVVSSYLDGGELTQIQSKAANIDGMRNITSSDVVAISSVVDGSKTINQSKGRVG